MANFRVLKEIISFIQSELTTTNEILKAPFDPVKLGGQTREIEQKLILSRIAASFFTPFC